MFHALTSARRALADQGMIFNIHPAPDRPVIYCDAPEGREVVGLLRGSRARYRNAEARMERALRRGLFTLRHTAVIPYMHYASSLRTLRAHVKADWVGAGVDGATERRIRGILGQKAVGPLVIKEWVRVSLLRKT